jgi:hypothetical protein
MYTYYCRTRPFTTRVSTDVGLCNSAEIGIFSELISMSAEFRVQIPWNCVKNPAQNSGTGITLYRTWTWTWTLSVHDLKNDHEHSLHV